MLLVAAGFGSSTAAVCGYQVINLKSNAQGGIDVAALQARFAPVPTMMPDIAVKLPAVASYDLLLPSMGEAA